MHDQIRVVILQHEPHASPRTTLQWCEQRGVSFMIHQAADGVFPELTDSDRLIILGGDMNVDQESTYPWLRQEKRFLLENLKEGRKMLGICLGAQLMAEVLGARVSRHEFWERGFDDAHVVAGTGLPLQGRSIPVVQWHAYSFDIPHGARRALRGDRWQNQGFLYKDFAVGVQFHPEADAEFACEACEEDGMPWPADAEIRLGALKDWYFALLDFLFLN